MSKSFLIACIDIETSGATPVVDYQLLSLAVRILDTGETFYAETSWEYNDEYNNTLIAEGFPEKRVDPVAMRIHGLLPTSQVSDKRISLFLMDDLLLEFMSIFPLPLVPMGLNIGGFDLFYIQH